MANDTPILANRLERILAFMVASAIGLSILSFIAVIIGTAVGVRNFGEGAWPVVFFLPQIALPLGVVLIVALVIISGIRRGRESKDARS